MRSYARWGFLRGSNETQILPKSGEKFRPQPVFFYARAEGQALRNHLRSLAACCGERENITRSHKHCLPASAGCHQIFPFHSRAAKSPRVGKGFVHKKGDARSTHQLKRTRAAAARA